MERPGEETLIRYFLGKCDHEEQKIVSAYLALKIDEHYVDACLHEAFYMQEDGDDPVNQEQARDRVWATLIAKQQEASVVRLKPRMRWYRYAAAAIAFIVLSSGIAFLLNDRINYRADKLTWQHIEGESGHPKMVILADSSMVTLFPGSVIDIPSDFNKTDRQVKLNGRAFFQVSHDKEKPFYVSARELTTKVLGTSFEVNTIGTENIITLHTGKVSVIRANKEMARLIPNQQIRYQHDTGKYTIEKVDAAHTLNWLHGELDYDRVPLNIIINDIEKWYGVKIIVKQPDLLNQKVIFSFKDQSLDRVLSLLSKSADFSYEIKGKEVILKGRSMEIN